MSSHLKFRGGPKGRRAGYYSLDQYILVCIDITYVSVLTTQAHVDNSGVPYSVWGCGVQSHGLRL
jgi:hypothetical protein